MNPTPKVSVLMPAYNHEHYVSEAIESVLSQSFTDFEFLIGDDGSTDNTVSVIENYHDPRIKTFFHKSNYGACFNHRFLLERASGEYIALINSDDVWLPGKLEKQVAYLDEHPNVVLCSSWADIIDENGNEIKSDELSVFKQPNRTQEEWILYFFLHGNCICHPSVLARRSVYQKLDYYNLGMRQLPDFEMWIRMIREGDFFIFQESLAAHRRFIGSGENTSTPKIENSIRDVMESYYVLSEYLEDLPDDLFRRSFMKYFKYQDASTPEELCCERFFLLARGNYYMTKISKQAAIMFFLRHYRADVAKVFRQKYNYTVNDFYKLSSEVDLLGLSAITSYIEKDSPTKDEPDISLQQFIDDNRLKVIGMALFPMKSPFRATVKKIYHHMKDNK